MISSKLWSFDPNAAIASRVDFVIAIVVYTIHYNYYNVHKENYCCTHQMPAKKKLLPRPCPICGNLYGTIQIVIFSTSRNVICRLGHYDSEKYQNPSTVREKKSRGKRWCSFKINRTFISDNILPLEQDYEDLTSGNLGRRKSIPYTKPTLLIESIKEKGWNGEGEEYLRVVAKRLGLWKKFLKIPGFIGDEKHIFELLKHYAPNEIL